jgi:predicted MPP superfamily phosphohydrolase
MSTPPRSALRTTLRRSAIVLGLVLAAAALPPLLGARAESRRLHLGPSEIFVILACAGGLGALAIACLRATWLLARSRVLRQPLEPARRRIAVGFAALGLVLVGLWCYARYVEPTWLRVRHHTIALGGLAEPRKVVVFSDLHSDPRFATEDRLVAAIEAEHPDAIVFLGDALNRAGRAAHFRQTLARLHAPVKLAIRGNWDVWFWSDIDLFAGTGFDELAAGWRTIDLRGVPVRIGAHAFVDRWTPDRVLPAPPPGPGPTVFLYHATDYAHVAASQGIDLYLDGDTHGGQIALPWYGPLLSIGRRGRELSRGLYHLGSTTVVVTPGVGIERQLPYRFLSRPEVTVLDLVPR